MKLVLLLDEKETISALVNNDTLVIKVPEKGLPVNMNTGEKLNKNQLADTILKFAKK